MKKKLPIIATEKEELEHFLSIHGFRSEIEEHKVFVNEFTFRINDGEIFFKTKEGVIPLDYLKAIIPFIELWLKNAKARRTMKQPEPKLNQVWYSETLKQKIVVMNEAEINTIKRYPDLYVFIAETPHSEKSNEYGGIYSYLCGNEYCRCYQ